MFDVIQFSYDKDQRKTYLSLKYLLQILDDKIKRIFVVVDDKNPFNEEYTEKVLSLSDKVKIYPRDWKCVRNLLGHDHMVGFFEFMDKYMNDGSGDDIILKIDPDTVMFNDKIIEDLKNSENVIVGNYVFSSYYGIGHCYAFKKCAIKPVLEGLKEVRCDVHCCEDVETFRRILYWKNGIDLKIPKEDVKISHLKYTKRYRGERDGYFLGGPDPLFKRPGRIKEIQKKYNVACVGQKAVPRELWKVEKILEVFLNNE